MTKNERYTSEQINLLQGHKDGFIVYLDRAVTALDFVNYEQAGKAFFQLIYEQSNLLQGTEFELLNLDDDMPAKMMFSFLSDGCKIANVQWANKKKKNCKNLKYQKKEESVEEEQTTITKTEEEKEEPQKENVEIPYCMGHTKRPPLEEHTTGTEDENIERAINYLEEYMSEKGTKEEITIDGNTPTDDEMPFE